MLYEIHSFQVPGAPDSATLTVYAPGVSREIDPDIRRPAVVVCPGGGYEFTSDREAEPVALRLTSLGFNAFVLRYHTAPVRYPVPQLEAAYALHYVKTTAEVTHTNPERVFILGFSAGGHLAGSLGILWQRMDWARTLGLPEEAIRPAGMVLSYPVITSGPKAHQGSFNNLLGEARPAWNDTLSLEKQAGPEAVPAFLWHTWDDATVPVENSLMLASALRAAGVPFEMHIYPQGVHGLSLADEQVFGPQNRHKIRPDCQDWILRAARWMKGED